MDLKGHAGLQTIHLLDVADEVKLLLVLTRHLAQASFDVALLA